MNEWKRAVSGLEQWRRKIQAKQDVECKTKPQRQVFEKGLAIK